MDHLPPHDMVPDHATTANHLHLLWPVMPGQPLQTRASTPVSNDASSRVFHLDACFEHGGTWAGVEQLVEAAYLALQEAGAEEVIQAHLLELHLALPQYRDRIRPKHLSLTETVGADERTRFYALDHAYRLVHGLVDVVLQAKRHADTKDAWTVVAWNFDAAEHLARRFFAELARRAAARHEFDVYVEADRSLTTPLPGVRAVPVRQLPHNAGLVRPPANSTERDDITLIESAVANGDDVVLEQKHQTLLARYRAAGDKSAVVRTAARIFLIYNSFGYYHEARRFMPDIQANFEELIDGDEAKRLHYVGKMNLCLVLTGDAEAGLQVVKDLAASYVTKPYVLAGLNYIVGMHHLRYAQAKDIGRSEEYIQQAVDDIKRAKDDLSPGAYAFRKVFIDNGLAFVRARQGRHEEAVELCKAGYQFLTSELGEDRHLLHRSVLQYNIAQVYVMLGQLEDGLAYYRNAIRMDPNYSEYHNEVGNILQEMGEFRSAIQHYQRAIECSPPYPEVYFNKAVCHARLEELDEALACFDISLELEPDHGDRHALRADVLRELGRADDALEGYDAAVALGYDTTALRVNRAVLYYNRGAYGLALSDMDHVIRLEADHDAHYENRAEIHRAMLRDDLYHNDIAMAERCREAA
jgi:tetratricopeptide (TPR) repeat protein